MAISAPSAAGLAVFVRTGISCVWTLPAASTLSTRTTVRSGQIGCVVETWEDLYEGAVHDASGPLVLSPGCSVACYASVDGPPVTKCCKTGYTNPIGVCLCIATRSWSMTVSSWEIFEACATSQIAWRGGVDMETTWKRL
ncbi:predicted protein [Pyrenophora tritici-repentis Pt-1C-BFP]|uniref:Uncharacterized protein n=1 Tax=Pyrenophora tritici-repentis (strain Pt-1C-BFP) TaxID=426418 RepID=B2W8X1_PYRTR|nr:uncharacterized protein PTRG_06429 [Pyrenophora tritici-repentis Pt-1C-BFP]EDU49349.1 predicted protein [Pyrenophora tritici-repentis Pt-1C-BFP]